MSIVNGTFTAGSQTSSSLRGERGQFMIASLSGTWTGGIIAEFRESEASSWTQCATLLGNGSSYAMVTRPQLEYRLRSAMISSGSCYYRLEQCDKQQNLNPEWDDLRFPANGINPTGAVGDPGVDQVETSFPGTLLFDKTTVEMIAITAQMPHDWLDGTPIRPHIHWARTTTASGTVHWQLYYRHIKRGEAPGDWVGPIDGIDATNDPALAEAEIITSFDSIDMNGYGASHMMCFRLYRKADVNDTYDADARLHEFDIHYQRGTIGSAAEFLKPKG